MAGSRFKQLLKTYNLWFFCKMAFIASRDKFFLAQIELENKTLCFSHLNQTKCCKNVLTIVRDVKGDPVCGLKWSRRFTLHSIKSCLPLKKSMNYDFFYSIQEIWNVNSRASVWLNPDFWSVLLLERVHIKVQKNTFEVKIGKILLKKV